MTTTLTYLDAVRSELSDLPAGEREELLEDIATSLAESGESDADIEARLGPPARFAQELRSAAGLAAAAPPASAPASPRGARLRGLSAQLPPLAHELAPLGWLIRGYVAAVVIGFTVGGEWVTNRPGVFYVRDSVWNAFWLTVVCMALSVALGIGMRLAKRRPLSLVVVNGLFAVGAVWVALAALVGATNTQYYDNPVVSTASTDGLTYNGAVVENVYPYARNGKRLYDVRLYDQYGQQLMIGGPDSGDQNRRVPRSASGARAFHAFPIRYFEPGTRRIADPDAGWATRKPALVSPRPIDDRGR